MVTGENATAKRKRAVTRPGIETQNVSFKFPPELVVALDKIALDEGRSRNSSVRIKLAAIVKEYREGKNGKEAARA